MRQISKLLYLKKSCKFFERFKIDIEFLEHSPEKWGRRRSFTQSRNKISQLRVVTDCAERAVHLTQRYVDTLIHDEEQKQYIIQCVSESKKKLFGDTRKTNFVKKLKTSD